MFEPNLGSLLNPTTWRLGDYIGRKKLFSIANDIRKKEGLPPIKSLQQKLYITKNLTLIASSPSISIRQKDWGNNIHITGELNIKTPDQKPPFPDDLKEFLNSGPTPKCITFGSISPYRAQETTELIRESVKESGCRAIIQADWDNVRQSDIKEDNIYKCNRLPHAEVFPYCALVIHHGGTGTTHAALRAGCPAIVIAHAFDQTFWGNELKRLGVAGKVLHRNRITAKRLTEAINVTINSQEMKRNAMIISKKMRDENGVETSVRLIGKRFSAS